MSVVEKKPPAPMPAQVGAEQRLLLHDVDWQTYDTLCELFENRNLRLTYDRGDLEFMAPSYRHENYGFALGRLVEVMAEEMHMAVEPGGSTTFRRQDLERGLEPDHCFWIVHEPQVRGKTEIDLTRDPSPDLFLEVEISRSVLDRLAICAALGIPEVWRFDGTSLTVLRLQADGTYQECQESRFFPGIPPAGLVPFLQPDRNRDYLSRIRAFRQWVRQQLENSES